MKKKILSVFILSVLTLNLTACIPSMRDVKGNIERNSEQTTAETTTAETTTAETTTAETTTVETTEETEAPSEEIPLELGTSEGGVYENRSIGIGLELNETWTILTQEEISKNTDSNQEIMKEYYDGDFDIDKLFENDNVFDDMVAQNNNGDTIAVSIEKISPYAYALYTEEDIFEHSLPMLDEMYTNTFTNIGYEKVTVSYSDVSTIDIDGKSFCSVEITVNLNDILDVHQFIIIKKFAGSYYATIAINSYDKNVINDFQNSLYIVE